MNLTPNLSATTIQLMEKGVRIPCPWTVEIGDDLEIGRISGNGVTIHAGCRIRGRETVISSGVQIGREGPVTIEDCQIGPEVELRAGYFCRSVFLRKANAGWGAHVREGCILEEEAGCAHCVDLKHTILFPFVTLGSLINFCDCLMAGGTSRKDHSEVGSSYIHFNFTPDGDKATASMFGDVPRGVMLNQRPIFLGGQGGAVGPVRVAYGTVVSAGTILRKDVLAEGNLIVGKAYHGGTFPFVRDLYRGLAGLVEKNIRYLANLTALEQWYLHVRKETLRGYELGDLIHAGALRTLARAKEERLQRLKAVAEKMPRSIEAARDKEKVKIGKLELYEKMDAVRGLFSSNLPATVGKEWRDAFLEGMVSRMKTTDQDHVTLIQALPEDVLQTGTRWLHAVVHDLCLKTAGLMPSLNLFRD